uniref:Mmc1 C-terminal domain-containing protein n=1 Tax=Colletotrichum fructicola (strain Nara gc5) TaxID=1213859 RepID=L2G650_COLFN
MPVLLALHSSSDTFTTHDQQYSTGTLEAAPNARSELIDILLELQKHAVNHVNLSRLQLALQGLRQEPGHENVRVAILALADGAGEPGKTARELLRPLVVRVGEAKGDEGKGTTLTISKTNLLHELDVSSPALNGCGVELLLMEVNPLSAGAAAAGQAAAVMDVEQAVLVPTVDIQSSSGRYTPVTTPVHKAIVVSEGIMGAATVAALPLAAYRDSVLAAVNLPKYPVEEGEQLAFQPIDVSVGSKGLDRIRENIGNAMEYERAWYKSNVPAIVEWLKAGQQLDLAFAGTRWRKLGWWKLFWRVDDVGVLTSDMLNQRFLPGAERELVFLAGRIAESGVVPALEAPTYTQPTSELQPQPETKTITKITSRTPKWPTHISFTRRYLHEETVPALQALAQKLVLQASSTSALTGALAGLLYVSQYAGSIYEAGAVAALGIMWSLRNLQKKWETARTYWEGEVREEGRKAVRAVEQSVVESLDTPRDTPIEGEEELRKAKELVEKAEDALKRLE